MTITMVYIVEFVMKMGPEDEQLCPYLWYLLYRAYKMYTTIVCGKDVPDRNLNSNNSLR